jgi:hypothetical protein
VPEAEQTDRRGEERERGRVTSFDAGAVFDGIGLPLLQLSAPIYLHLDARPKLRDLGSSSGSSAFAVESFGGGGGVASSSGLQLPGTESLLSSGGASNFVAPAAVPEPATLLLVTPAALLVARRVRAARRASRP